MLIFAAVLLVAADEGSEADKESTQEAQSEYDDEIKDACDNACEFMVECGEEEDAGECTTSCVEEVEEFRQIAGDECAERTVDMMRCFGGINDCEQAGTMLLSGSCESEMDAFSSVCHDALLGEVESPEHPSERDSDSGDDVQRPKEVRAYCGSICDDLVACKLEEDDEDCRAECEELYDELIADAAAGDGCDEPFVSVLQCIDGIEECGRLKAFDSGDEEICEEEMQAALSCSIDPPEATESVEASPEIKAACTSLCEKEVECGNSSDADGCADECVDDFVELAQSGEDCEAALLTLFECGVRIDDCEEFDSADVCQDEAEELSNACL